MKKSWMTFSKNYEKLLESGEGYDLSIKAGQEPDVKYFKAHSVILRTHSPYFYRALSNEWAKKEEDKMVFYKPNVTPTIFEIILRYVYTGVTEIKKEQTGEFILSLLTAADELILPELMDEVQEYFINNHALWIQEQFYRILDFAFGRVAYKLLQDYCLGAICADPSSVLESDYFYCMDVNMLTSLLKRDDLGIDEVELWNNVIKWGLVLNPTLTDDPANWTPEFMTAFQQSLADCIPLIRFTLMTPAQFREKVWPFKDILPAGLYDSVLWYFLMPGEQANPFTPRIKTIDSKLITLKQAAMIASWIDQREEKFYTYTEIPYDFKLLMRGSKDGYSQQALHQRCSGQEKTFLLLKIKSTQEIFGMYISGVWNVTASARAHDSFMFSFSETTKPVLSRVRSSGYDLALSRGIDRGMEELEMFKVSPKISVSSTPSSPSLQ